MDHGGRPACSKACSSLSLSPPHLYLPPPATAHVCKSLPALPRRPPPYHCMERRFSTTCRAACATPRRRACARATPHGFYLLSFCVDCFAGFSCTGGARFSGHGRRSACCLARNALALRHLSSRSGSLGLDAATAASPAFLGGEATSLPGRVLALSAWRCVFGVARRQR